MRISMVLGLALLCLACGSKDSDKKKEPPKPDLSKMTALEQCQTVAGQLAKCKDNIVSSTKKALGGKNVDLGDLQEMADDLGQAASRCGDARPEEMAPFAACYDTDCGGFAKCITPLLVDMFRGGGSDQPSPRPAQPAEQGMAVPAPTTPQIVPAPEADIRTLPAGEACRRLGAQTRACKTAIVDAARKIAPPEMTEAMLANIGEAMSSGGELDHCTSEMDPASDPLFACYDDDCGKFAGCLARLLIDAIESVNQPLPDKNK